MQTTKKLLLMAWGVLGISTFAQAQEQKVETKNGKKYIIYKVQEKETVYSIARAYKVAPKEIMALNPELEKGLRAGELINVPFNMEEVKVPTKLTKSAETDQAIEEVKYTVKKGDFLNKIAKDQGIEVEELRKWNELDGDKITPGQELIVGIRTGKSIKKNNETKKDNTLAVNTIKDNNKKTIKNIPVLKESNVNDEPAFKQVEHIVQGGETLSAIARQYKVSNGDIMHWNDLANSNLKADQKLKIFVHQDFQTKPTDNEDNKTLRGGGNNDPFENLNNSNPTTNNNPPVNNNLTNPNPNNEEVKINPQSTLINYIVQDGETVHQLRNRFNISSTEIEYWNNLSPTSLIHPGEELKLYIPQLINHTVQANETPESIAAKYGVKVVQMQIWNKIAQNQMRKAFAVGQSIMIYKPTGPTPTDDFRKKHDQAKLNKNLNTSNPDNNTSPNNNQLPQGALLHTTQGEGLYDVALKYNISVTELKEWNNIPKDNYYVAPGTQLKIYHTNTKTTNNNNQNSPTTVPNTNTNKPNTSLNNNNSAYNNNQNPFGTNKEYSTSSTSGDPFDQLNNSTVNTVNKNNNSVNNNVPNSNLNTDNGTVRGINPDNPPSNSDYGNTNTAKYLDNNNVPKNNTLTNPNPTGNTNSEEIKEDGFASFMSDIPSPKPFVALHRTAPVGTLVIVKNPSNQKSIVVEVVGPIDNSQLQNGVIIQLTPAVLERLGTGSNKMIPVEISYRPRPNSNNR